MDAELSLLVANQALCNSGTFVFDPFSGTGSLLITSSAFGSFTIGSDIDSRTFKGKIMGHNIFSNFQQYGISNLLIDMVTCDQSNSIWRPIPFFDAIVCDPPYGVREGARKVGKKQRSIRRELTHPKPKERNIHITQCIPYPVVDILTDLLAFASRMLVIGGRLVYWLPTTDKYKEKDIPSHPCLKLISNSEQPITMRWRRRLITMEKNIEYNQSLHENIQIKITEEPAHKNFSSYILKRDQNIVK